MDVSIGPSSRSRVKLPLISHIRQNHALEHATLHVLGEEHPNLRLIGRSSLWGFYVYGNVSAEQVLAAAQEGLHRLQAGQWQLALHPNCGSNLAVAGLMAGTGAFLALGGRSKGWLARLARLPLACIAAMLGIMLSQPVGYLLQARVTTQPNVEGLRIVDLAEQQRAGLRIYHVRTAV
jgi:hypothetical protein